MIYKRDMVYMSGTKQVHVTKDNGRMEKDMVKELGHKAIYPILELGD
jgi:hypothetical protein